MSDLISRQMAIDVIKKDRDASDMPKMWYQGVDYAINHLIHLPSAQPEQKVGKWIVMDDDRISGRCSVCGWEAHMYEDDVVGMDYCPNCGAKMEE